MELIDYYREIQSDASKDAYTVTCHYLKVKDGIPEPHGSGVFIKISNNYFLITAAHVIDKKENDIYVGIENKEVLKLGGELTMNRAPYSRDEDRIDLAIMKLCDESITRLSPKYSFLDISEIGINHEFRELPLYQSVGFPASQSKYNRYKNELKSKPFIYTTMPASQELYDELDCESFSNIIVHYDKKKVRDYKSNKLVTGPDPFGISGSGLWYIPTNQLKAKGEKVEKRLVAIMTEWSIKNRKYWIGTRIDIFTEIIRQKYGLEIPQSKIVKVNLE